MSGAYIGESRSGLKWVSAQLPPFDRRAERWKRPELAALLRADESIVWSDIGVTGILGLQYLSVVPAIPFGSAFWDVALTGERFLAVELPLIGLLKRRWKTWAVPWPDVTRAEMRRHTDIPAVSFKIEASGLSRRFKLAYAALDYAGSEAALLKVCPEATISTDLFVWHGRGRNNA